MATGVTIDFNANLAKFETSVKKASDRMERFERDAKRRGDGIRKAFARFVVPTAAIAGFTAATKSALNYADSIADASEKTAFSATKIQELKFAAEQNGIAFNTLEGALARFTKRLGLARAGTGAAAQTYKDLGIDLQQTNDQVFSQVVATFGAMENETNRLALATRLFGDDAQRMAVLVSGGNESLQAYADKARELGLILSDDLVQGASDANDQLDIMQKVIGTQVTRVLVELAPIITRVGQSFADAVPKIRSFFESFDSVDTQGIDALKQTYSRLESQLEREQVKLYDRMVINSKKSTGRVWNPITDAILPSEEEIRARIDALREQMQEAADYIEIEQAKINDRLFEKKYGLNQPSAPAAVDTTTLFSGGGESGAVATTTKGIDAQQQALRQLAGELKQADEELRRFSDDLTRTHNPAQEVAEDLAMIEAAFERGWISAETYGEATLEAMNRLSDEVEELPEKIDEVNDVAEDLGMTFSSALEEAIVSGGNFRDMLKGIEQDVLRIITRKNITKPLADSITGMLGGGSSGGIFGDIFGSFFGGARAMGGPVSMGKAYVVGERGPELFMPRQSGNIIPNGAAPGGVTVNMKITTPNADSFRRSEKQIGHDMRLALSRAR